MKVIQVNIRLNEGGASTIARELHERALGEGFESVFAYGYGPGARPSTAEQTIPRSMHLTTRTRAIANYAAHRLVGVDPLGLARSHADRFMEELAGADIVHLHAIHSHMGSYRWILDRLHAQGKPIVWTMHDSWILTGRCAITHSCERWREGCGHCPARMHYPGTLLDLSATEYRAKRDRIDRLKPLLTHVAISEFMRRRLQDAYPDHAVTRIPNGIDRQLEAHLHRLPRRAGGGPFRLLIAGADLSDPHKQDLALLHRVAEQGHELVTVGAHSPFTASNVTNRGRISDRAALAAEYAQADAVLFTSRIDNFPLVVVEALCAGTPVLALDSMGSREVLAAVGARTVEPAELLRLLSSQRCWVPYPGLDPTSLRSKALEQFSSDTMGRRYFDLYRRILEG